jgi:FtsZ-binding cell division protein ZapB
MNSWIQHVKQFAKKNNMSYSKALKHPDCSKSYKRGTGAKQSRIMPDGTGARLNRVMPYEPRNRYEQIDIQVEDYIQTIQILDSEINELDEMIYNYQRDNNDPMTNYYIKSQIQSEIRELRRIKEAAINSRNNYMNAVNRLRQEQSELTQPDNISVSSINFDDI